MSQYAKHGALLVCLNVDICYEHRTCGYVTEVFKNSRLKKQIYSELKYKIDSSKKIDLVYKCAKI